ncbi:hypothetical protein FHW04_004747, partial [Pantoea sp. AN62]
MILKIYLHRPYDIIHQVLDLPQILSGLMPCSKLPYLKSINYSIQLHCKRKRTARTVLTGMCYSVGSVMRQGSSSLTRLTG